MKPNHPFPRTWHNHSIDSEYVNPTRQSHHHLCGMPAYGHSIVIDSLNNVSPFPMPSSSYANVT